MMTTIDDLGDGCVGVEAHGQVTDEDYRKVLIPAVEDALHAHTKIRFLYRLAPDFTGFTAAALWDDARVGIQHLRGWDRVAVVTDVRWVIDAVKAFRVLLPATTKVFRNDEMQAAKDWLTASAS